MDRRGMIGVVDALFFMTAVSVVCCLLLAGMPPSSNEAYPMEAPHSSILRHQFVVDDDGNVMDTVELVALHLQGQGVEGWEDRVRALIDFVIGPSPHTWSAVSERGSVLLGDGSGDGEVLCHRVEVISPYGGERITFELKVFRSVPS